MIRLRLMGDGKTPSFAEAMVLQKAKQMALEEAGTYVESYTKVQNLNLSADEILTLTGGVLHVELLEKIRSLVYKVRGGLGHGTNRASETRPDVSSEP